MKQVTVTTLIAIINNTNIVIEVVGDPYAFASGSYKQCVLYTRGELSLKTYSACCMCHIQLSGKNVLGLSWLRTAPCAGAVFEFGSTQKRFELVNR